MKNINEEIFISTLNLLPDRIAILDDNGIIIFVNDSWRKFVSEKQDTNDISFIGKHYSYFNDNSNHTSIENSILIDSALEKLINGQLNEFKLEYSSNSPSSEAWYHIEFKKTSTGFLILQIDITDKISTAKKIKQQEIFIEETQSLANIGSWAFDFESNNLIHTAELQKICEIDKEKSGNLDSVFLSHFYNENEDALFRWLSYANPKQPTKEFEFDFKTPTGINKRIFSKAMIKFSEDELPVSLFSFIQDITSQYNKEKEITELYKALSQFNNQLQEAREGERTDVAREIHDEIGQQLTVLKIKIRQINKDTNHDLTHIKELAAEANLILESVFENIKKILSTLRPAVLDDLGLIAAIEWHLSEIKKTSNINYVFVNENTQNYYSQNITSNVYRIIQEACDYILKHTKADLIELKIYERGNKLHINIAENGLGESNIETGKKENLGIIGIKERINLLKGEIKMTNRENGGSLLQISIPVT